MGIKMGLAAKYEMAAETITDIVLHGSIKAALCESGARS
jgi:hypothetical protein